MLDIKNGKGLSEELQNEISLEQLENSMNKTTREQWLEERKKGTLKSIASEMKKWTQNNRYEYV